MTSETLNYALMAAIGIIGWFLKGVMSDFKNIKAEVSEHDKEIGIIKSEQGNSNKRFDRIDENFKSLSDKIDSFMLRITNTSH